MGCCASVNKAPPAPHLNRNSSFTKSSRVPPPLEEESVKEVLSETPTSKPKIEIEPKKFTPKQTLHKIREGDNNMGKKPILIHTEEVSEEVSEICSTLSESVSTATFNEKRDDEEEGEVRQRVMDRSPEKFRNRSLSGDLRRERVVGKSPARGSEQSPGRVRSVPGRESRGFITADRQKRDYGESSGPRSRSPANRTVGSGSRNGFGRCPSARKTGNSPGRVGSDLHEKNQKAEGGASKEGNWPPTATDESLENPLVSLECFIFL